MLPSLRFIAAISGARVAVGPDGPSSSLDSSSLDSSSSDDSGSALRGSRSREKCRPPPRDTLNLLFDGQLELLLLDNALVWVFWGWSYPLPRDDAAAPPRAIV